MRRLLLSFLFPCLVAPRLLAGDEPAPPAAPVPNAPAEPTAEAVVAKLAKLRGELLDLAREGRKLRLEENLAGHLNPELDEKLLRTLPDSENPRKILQALARMPKYKYNARIDAMIARLDRAAEAYAQEGARLLPTATQLEIQRARVDWLAHAPREKTLAHATALDDLRAGLMVRPTTRATMTALNENLEGAANFLRESVQVPPTGLQRNPQKFREASIALGLATFAEIQTFDNASAASIATHWQTAGSNLRKALLAQAPPEEIAALRTAFVAAREAAPRSSVNRGNPENFERVEVFANWWGRACTIPVSSGYSETLGAMDHFATEFATVEPELARLATQKAADLREKLKAHPEELVQAKFAVMAAIFDPVVDGPSAQAALKNISAAKLEPSELSLAKSTLETIVQAYEDPGPKVHFILPKVDLARKDVGVAPSFLAARERAARYLVSRRALLPRLLEPPFANQPVKEALAALAKEQMTASHWSAAAGLLEDLAELDPPPPRDIELQLKTARLLAQGAESEREQKFAAAAARYREAIKAGGSFRAFAEDRLKALLQEHPDTAKPPAERVID